MEFRRVALLRMEKTGISFCAIRKNPAKRLRTH
jgi:hypothetical protein